MRWPAALALLAALAQAAPAHAVAAAPSGDLPDLAAEKALIYSGEYAQAITRLEARAREVQHAEIYNLLGYSQRQLRRYDEAARSYQEALFFDGSYRPALQYQGELFIATGDIAGARRNLGYLRIVCGPQGCEEIDQLAQALEKAGHKP
jgi:Flp pilus assembly protein TadD